MMQWRCACSSASLKCIRLTAANLFLREAACASHEEHNNTALLCNRAVAPVSQGWRHSLTLDGPGFHIEEDIINLAGHAILNVLVVLQQLCPCTSFKQHSGSHQEPIALRSRHLINTTIAVVLQNQPMLMSAMSTLHRLTKAGGAPRGCFHSATSHWKNRCLAI